MGEIWAEIVCSPLGATEFTFLVLEGVRESFNSPGCFVTLSILHLPNASSPRLLTSKMFQESVGNQGRG